MSDIPEQPESGAHEVTRGDLATRGHELHQELLQLKATATVHFYRLGEIMKEIRDQRLWEAMGHESMRAYIADPELDFEEGSVYRAIKLTETFPDVKRLEHVPVGKLLVILPHVNEGNLEDLLKSAAALSRSDLIHQLDTGEMEERHLSVLPLPKIYRCNECKKVKGVFFHNLCHCGWTPKQIEIISKAIADVEENL